MDLADKLKNLPSSSGVYIFRDELGRVIYIGKATSLKNRVKQYFQGSEMSEGPRRAWLRRSISDLDYIVVNTPIEALILEANLIKRHRPYFNVRMKDDKRYPCIELTIHENFPRIRIVRRPENKKSRYFGPYTSTIAMRRTFKLIQKAFKIRTCKYDLEKPLDRPCLDYHINLCAGPCVRNVSKEEYGKMVKRAADFLDGRSAEIIENLHKEIEKDMENLEYEKCAANRDLIQSIEHVTSKYQVVTKVGDDADYIGIARGDEQAAISVLQVRDGKILGQQRYVLEMHIDEGDGEVLYRFFQMHYNPGFFIPPSIFVSSPVEGGNEISEWLSGLKGRKVEIKIPERGDKKAVLEIAMSNAIEFLSVEKKISGETQVKNKESLLDLRKILGLSEIPRRIEGFDISNIGGTMAVGSMVVFIDGEPFKPHYRRFRINTVEGQDDFAMMNETLSRRFKNLKLGELESFGQRPDLILIDGGKGQLNAAVEAADILGVGGLNIISIAKKEEEIFTPGLSEPLPADPESPGVRLLRRVRDEAHRFAVAYHRKLREKNIEVSILDGIPGISRRRKETLLQYYDSIDDIARASLYELQELPGFNRQVAENVLRYLETSKES